MAKVVTQEDLEILSNVFVASYNGEPWMVFFCRSSYKFFTRTYLSFQEDDSIFMEVFIKLARVSVNGIYREIERNKLKKFCPKEEIEEFLEGEEIICSSDNDRILEYTIKPSPRVKELRNKVEKFLREAH